MSKCIFPVLRHNMERVYVWCITLCMCVVANSVADREITVYVNRVLLDDTEGDRVLYWYAPDDVVDIWCLDLRTPIFRVTLDYQFGDEIIGGNGSYGSSSSVNMVGLRTRLRAAHNGSSVTCRSEYGSSMRSITVQLLMRASFDGALDLKLNAVLIRYQQAPDPASHSYLVQYIRRENESFTLECNTSLNDVVVQAFKGDHLVPYSKVNVEPEDLSSLTYVVHNNATVLRNVTLQFHTHFNLYDDPLPLSMNTTNTLELYDLNGARDIYYNYDEGETMSLNCSTTVEIMSTHNYVLVFDGTVQTTSHYIVNELKLEFKGEERMVYCMLYSRYKSIEYKRIRVLFRHKARLAWANGTAVSVFVGDSNGTNVPVIIGVFIGIGVTCVACGLALAARRWWRTLARRRDPHVTAGAAVRDAT